MSGLSEDLIIEKTNLEQFKDIAIRTINFVFESVNKEYYSKDSYRIYYSESFNKHIRPINSDLFIFDTNHFHEGPCVHLYRSPVLGTTDIVYFQEYHRWIEFIEIKVQLTIVVVVSG